MKRLVLIGFLALLWPVPHRAQQQAVAPQAPAPDGEYFVTVGPNVDFQIGCQRFFPAIWNQWEVLEAGAGAPFLLGASLPPGTTGPQLLRDQMAQAGQSGLTVMRAWAQGVDPMFSLQTAPGQYNEEIFAGLDYALDQARQHNIKVILAFIDNWNSIEGVDKYVAWTSDPALGHNDFFTNPQMMQWYQAHVKTIVSRVNSVNGRTYSEDPTIFGWELINEPRVDKTAPPGVIAAWINQMAPYVKTLDSKHLLSVGEDGFWSTTRARILDNPIYVPDGTNWAPESGQDFIADHSSPAIDFAAFHSWPDNWDTVRPDFPAAWIATHTQDAATLRKPVIMEEFGKWVNATANSTVADRNTFFGYHLDAAQQQIASGAALKGAGFWEWYAPGQQGPANEGGGSGLYGVLAADQAFADFSAFAKQLAAYNTPIPGCVPPSPAPAPNAMDCSSTAVRGLAGTGYEGAECTTDINECVRATDDCSGNATCINTDGSFTCSCWWGFEGDGATCTPAPQLANLAARYSLSAPYQGPLLCDVRYPTLAPGFIFDPTGALNAATSNSSKQNGVGNPAPVATLEECQIACESAPGCSSIVYSPGAQNCFLKGCPSENTVTCPDPPPPGTPGGLNGPPLAAPAPPAPNPPPCTLAPYLCPFPDYPYISYYSIDRYQPDCTTVQANPGVAFSPSGLPGKSFIALSPDGAGVGVPIAEVAAFTPAALAPVGGIQSVGIAAATPPGSILVASAG